MLLLDTHFYDYILNDLYFFFWKTRVILRNSLSNPYEAKQTLEGLNFEALYFFKYDSEDSSP